MNGVHGGAYFTTLKRLGTGPWAAPGDTGPAARLTGNRYLTIITELPARSSTWKAMSVSNSHHFGLCDDRAMTMTE
jgi:hypothetical protein